MPAELIDGKRLAAALRQQIAHEAGELAARGRRPHLAALLIGDNDAARTYAASQEKTTAEVGIDYRLHALPIGTTSAEVAARLAALNADAAVQGIMLHLPVPPGLDGFALQQLIAPGKDVEGVSAANLGLLMMDRSALPPCTAAAAFECVRSTGVDLRGCNAVVIGRSAIVGKPLASLLLASHATVTTCHSRTRDLAEHSRRAQVVVVAVGQPGLIGREHIGPGAVVVDVGTNRVADESGKMRTVGDVRFDEVREVAGWLTPVPGGVGPLTVAMLLRNVVRAAGE